MQSSELCCLVIHVGDVSSRIPLGFDILVPISSLWRADTHDLHNTVGKKGIISGESGNSFAISILHHDIILEICGIISTD